MVRFAASLRKSKTGFVLPSKGTVPLAPASLVVCSQSLPRVSSGNCTYTQWLLHSLIQQKSNTEKTIIFKQKRQREGWVHVCSHPWEEQCAFGSCTAGSNLSQTRSHKLTVSCKLWTMIALCFSKNMDFYTKPCAHTQGKSWEGVLEGGACTEEGALMWSQDQWHFIPYLLTASYQHNSLSAVSPCWLLWRDCPCAWFGTQGMSLPAFPPCGHHTNAKAIVNTTDASVVMR